MVNFEPQTGDEIQKERPAVVLNLPGELSSLKTTNSF